MFTLLRLAAWSINRHLYGAHTAAVIWSLDTTIARVERIEGGGSVLGRWPRGRA